MNVGKNAWESEASPSTIPHPVSNLSCHMGMCQYFIIFAQLPNLRDESGIEYQVEAFGDQLYLTTPSNVDDLQESLPVQIGCRQESGLKNLQVSCKTRKLLLRPGGLVALAQRGIVVDIYGSFHSHGGTPIAGWFMPWKIVENPSGNGWELGVLPWLRKPPYDSFCWYGRQ